MNRAKPRNGLKWLWIYTAMFACGAAMLVLIMRVFGRSLVWAINSEDGLRQHYTTIGYMGQVLRGLLSGKGCPMYSFRLGQGMDVMTTLAYYGFTDPLTLLAVFAAGDGIETVYAVISLLRMYLTGVALAVYVRQVGAKAHWAVACSAAVYAFSGFCLAMMGRHPYFLNGPLYLPLLLTGVERVLSERRWLAYVLAAALMLAVNFYFAYMNTVVAIVYIVVRLIVRLRARGVKESAKDGFMLLGGYLLGAALAAAVFLPMARLFFTSSRLGEQAGYTRHMWHYEAGFYQRVALLMFLPWGNGGHFTRLNLFAVAMFAIVALLWSRDRRKWQVLLGMALCGAGICLPLAGKLMNGGAYVSNRWAYALALFIALACALGLPQLTGKQKAPRRAAMIAVALWLPVCVFLLFRLRSAGSALAMATVTLPLLALLFVYDRGWLKWLTRKRLEALLAVGTALFCALHTMMAFTPLGAGYIRQQAKAGIYGRLTSATAAYMIEDDDFCRVSQAGYHDSHSPLLGYTGTSFYWSLVDGEMSRYYKDLWLPAQVFSDGVDTLGASAVMNEVASVKYFTRKTDERYTVPCGYELTETLTLPDGTGAEVYENRYALPLGYAYDAVMDRATYDALPVEDKLQALMRCAVVDGLQETSDGAFRSGAVALDCRITALEGATLEDDRLQVREGGAIRLAFDAPEDCEIYVLIENLGPIRGNQIVSVQSDNGTNTGMMVGTSSNFYFGKDDLAFCLGSGPLNACEISFARGANYRYESIRAVALPLAAYREDAEARRAESMTDVKLDGDRVTGRISASGDRVLQLSIPYSQGWRAWVDGEERPLFRCGGMYTGVEIGAGEHTIELRYATPWLKPGAAVSAAALAAIIALLILDRRFRRAGGKNKEAA